VADGDVWYRTITNTRHFKGGRAKPAALRKAVGSPKNPGSPWKAEISGLLRSLAPDIEVDGATRAARDRANVQKQGQSGKDFEFVGVIYARASDVRLWEISEADVVFDPREDEPAHANLVFRHDSPDRILTMLDDFITFLGHAPCDELDMIPPSQGGAPTAG
jgi:hypothetical protein